MQPTITPVTMNAITLFLRVSVVVVVPTNIDKDCSIGCTRAPVYLDVSMAQNKTPQVRRGQGNQDACRTILPYFSHSFSGAKKISAE